MKTHRVIDQVYNDSVFAGTYEECENFIEEQNSYGYGILPLTKQELDVYNNCENIESTIDFNEWGDCDKI